MATPEQNDEQRQGDFDFIEQIETKEIYKERAAIFAELWLWMEKNIYRINILKGWTEKERNRGEMIALMHSELSEALEGLRHNNPPSDKIPDVTQAEEELADVIIRLMDLAFMEKWNIPKALFLKLEYNKSREYRHGGKLF